MGRSPTRGCAPPSSLSCTYVCLAASRIYIYLCIFKKKAGGGEAFSFGGLASMSMMLVSPQVQENQFGIFGFCSVEVQRNPLHPLAYIEHVPLGRE